LPAKDAGFSVTNKASTWKAEPGDKVILSSKFVWAPSRLLTALSHAPALAEVPSALDVPDALSRTLSCQSVATEVIAAGPDPSEAYPGCDAGCFRALCEVALVTLWQRAADASLLVPGGSATLEWSASGPAKLDEYARPVSFSGSWIGSLKIGVSSAAVGGSASAWTAPSPS
jgi:hypothetical protein